MSDEELELDHFLRGFTLVGLSRSIAEQTAWIRKSFKMRLPDAIIWATAKTEGCLLVTRNFRDFPKDDIGVRIPYHVH
jgi:predicted nucleic acid-binding protein